MEQKFEIKKAYAKPMIQDHGSVTELTRTGCTNPGSDAMYGSVASQGRPPVKCK